MKPTMISVMAAILLAVALSGCGHKEHHGDSQGEAGHSHGADGSHSDSAQSFSGATHKEGSGITLLDETRKSLGILTDEVQEQVLPRSIRFAARVFDAGTLADDLAPSDALALGLVSTNDAALLHAGQVLQFQAASGMTATGVVQQVSQPLAGGEVEVIAAIPSPAMQFRLGDSGEVTISVSDQKTALVVPREAVIKGANGDLVYVVNGEAFTMTWVQLGAEAGGLVEITDGLLAGDSVVTKGAMDLWLVELRAVKGGQGCCPAPPKKGKG